MWQFFAVSLMALVAAISPTGCREIDESMMNLVADASAALFFPSAAIGALLCASAGNVAELTKVFSRKGLASAYLSDENFNQEIDRFALHKTIILLDFDCPRAPLILRKANESKLFAAPLKWLVLQDSRNYSSNDCTSDDCFLDETKNLAIYPDSEIIVLRRISTNYVEILSIYRPSPVREMTIETRGFWTGEDGIVMRDTYVASRRRRNIQRTPLKSSIVVTNPDTLNHLTDYRDKHVDTITKCNYVWLHHLVDAMNATVSYSVVDSWGYRDKNGSWNGMMGQLSSGQIDIGGTGMFLVAERWRDVDYIPLYTPTRAAFIFRQPPLSFVSNLFTLPFRRSVWLAIGLLLLAILGLLVAVTRWEWSVREAVEQPAPTFSDNVLLVVGAVAQQGFGRNLQTVPSRIVLLMLLMAVLNLYASYSANIVALLQSTTTSIQNLRDLLASPIKCGVQDIVYNRYYLKMEKDPVRRAIIDQKIEPKTGKPNWLTADEGIKQVREGFFAFFMETGPGYKIIQETFGEDEKCGFREMTFIQFSPPALTIVKKSPYVEIIRVK